MSEQKKPTLSDAKCLTVTFLTPVSFASLNGGDKEADNISSIKKLSRGAETYPYVSAQAVRRALRDQIATMGHPLSEVAAATISKGAATTQCKPEEFIDDDLFGFMKTEREKEGEKGSTDKRTSPVRVSPLVALNPYAGDLDFGTNYMSVDAGGNPNIYETEIHAGLYRGTVLIELDRVGGGEGFKQGKELKGEAKKERVLALLKSLKNLWSSGRQSRFLADLSPKFVAAAILSVKNPIFLESVVPCDGGLNVEALGETLADFAPEVIDSVFGVREGQFATAPESAVSVGKAFEKMAEWVSQHYGE